MYTDCSRMDEETSEWMYDYAGLVEAHKACFPGNAVLRKRLDDWTEEFEAEEVRKKREAAASQEEQGWTVVKRRGVSLCLIDRGLHRRSAGMQNNLQS